MFLLRTRITSPSRNSVRFIRFSILRFIGGSVTAGTAYASYRFNEFTQTLRGYKDDFMSRMGNFNISFPERISDSNQSQDPPIIEDWNSASPVVGIVAADSINKNKKEEEEEEENTQNFDSMIKKMMQVRQILNTIDQDGTNLILPSIVVIGSQSSGKSSVLESIVGEEFLPKGNNMVTRRPLELCLINSPDQARATAEFPQLQLGEITDFKMVKRTLTDLNAAIPSSQCVSCDPIQLVIKSSSVPDLTLIDLPGYIQIHSKDQPPELESKIIELCEKYIKPQNIVLAVSAADVDLANSEALRRSRMVDPMGTRTIGVITKLDLVNPIIGNNLLNNKDYPLALGYVGVVCSGKNEKVTSQNYKQDFGIGVLRAKLIQTLEARLRDSLDGVYEAVDQELDEVYYQFKVLYNDRPISADGYVNSVLMSFKNEVSTLTKRFTKSYIRSIVRQRLEQRVIDLSERYYWFNERIKALTSNEYSADEGYWSSLIYTASGSLTKSGIGRSCTQGLVECMEKDMATLVEKEPFSYHVPFFSQVITTIQKHVKKKLFVCIDQIENSIKPLKYNVEFTVHEWKLARLRVLALMKSELVKTKNQLESIHSSYGMNNILDAVLALKNNEQRDSLIMEKAKEAVGLNYKIGHLEERLNSFSTKECIVPFSANVSNSFYSWFNRKDPRVQYEYECADVNPDDKTILIQKDPCMTLYPEVYLYVLLEKALSMTSMFIYSELIQDLSEPLPLLEEYKVYNMDPSWVKEFAKQNTRISEQIKLQDKKEGLERAREKLISILSSTRK